MTSPYTPPIAPLAKTPPRNTRSGSEIYFWWKFLIILLGLGIFAVVCRAIILVAYFKTEWTYGILVLVSIAMVALPRIMFSVFTAHYRRTIATLRASELAELSVSHVESIETVANNDPQESNRSVAPTSR